MEGLEQSLRSEQQRAQSEIHAQHDANTKAEQLLQQQISALENVVQRTQEEPLKSPDGPTDDLRFEHAREKLEYEEKELVLKQGELALKLLKMRKLRTSFKQGQPSWSGIRSRCRSSTKHSRRQKRVSKLRGKPLQSRHEISKI